MHSGTDPSVHLTPKLKNRYHPLVAILLFEVTRGRCDLRGVSIYVDFRLLVRQVQGEGDVDTGGK